MGVTTVRYPGGNFVSSYRWEDGVGPVDKRPARLDLAWHSLETNAFGLDEFMRWVGKAGVEPIMAVNLGTRGTAEAVDLLEYANHRGGSHLADQRRDNGAADPYGIRLWCLGNEMDGPWQVGTAQTRPSTGGSRQRPRKAMRRFDPDLELVACGSSHLGMPTFGSLGARRADRGVRRRRPDLAARVLPAGRRRPGQLPRLGRGHGHGTSTPSPPSPTRSGRSVGRPRRS